MRREQRHNAYRPRRTDFETVESGKEIDGVREAAPEPHPENKYMIL